MRDVSILLLTQGFYYILTGLWPLLNYKSFEAVTGPKTDVWLVKTVGLLIASIGAPLALAAFAQRPVPEIAILSMASAAVLAGVDVVYAMGRVISPIYLLDAAAEAALLAGWVRLGLKSL